VKAGRKKAKKDDLPAPEHSTPRTRARAALEDAQAASRVLDMVLPDAQADPLQVALPAPTTPTGPITRRYNINKLNKIHV